MKHESEMPETLLDYVREIGAPYSLLSDNAKSETSRKVKDILRKYCIKDMQTEPMHPNQNPAERRIQEVKKTTVLIMDRTGTPNNLWVQAMEYTCELPSRLSHVRLNNRTPYKVTFGVTLDISAYLVFHWYQEVLYYDPSKSFPEQREMRKICWSCTQRWRCTDIQDPH